MAEVAERAEGLVCLTGGDGRAFGGGAGRGEEMRQP